LDIIFNSCIDEISTLLFLASWIVHNFLKVNLDFERNKRCHRSLWRQIHPSNLSMLRPSPKELLDPPERLERLFLWDPWQPLKMDHEWALGLNTVLWIVGDTSPRNRLRVNQPRRWIPWLPVAPVTAMSRGMLQSTEKWREGEVKYPRGSWKFAGRSGWIAGYPTLCNTTRYRRKRILEKTSYRRTPQEIIWLNRVLNENSTTRRGLRWHSACAKSLNGAHAPMILYAN
jgi:hypothetical protein